jgi:hypothetical protein
MKKTIYLAFLFIALFLVSSCKKEVINCPNGKLRISSYSTNPYNIYIDGTFKVKLLGNTFVEYDLPQGEYTLKAEQVSGYLLFPTIKSEKVSIFGCKDTQWIFP